MTTDVQQYEAELNSLLSQLARFFKTNETSLSAEDCKCCLGRLPDNDQSALKKLFRMLQRKEKNTNSSYNKQSSDEQHYHSDDRCSSPDQIASNASHEETPDCYEEITTDSSDSGNDTVEDDDTFLRDTNFSHCAVKPPPSVNDVLVRCIENPHHFFTAVTQGSVPNKGGFSDAFCRVYKRQQRDHILRIHRRFDLHNLYALAVELGYHTGKKWKWGALNKVPGEILSNHPSLGLKEGEIREHLKHYVRIGRGYGRWIQHFGDPGYLIALPLNVTETEYTENRYSKCIPAAARKLRELGIDDVVKNLELSNLGEHIAKILLLEFNPLKPKARLITKRKEPLIDADEASGASEDRISSSTPPVNARQTQGTHDEPSQKRHRLQDENYVASTLLSTSPFSTNNTGLIASIRPTDASQTPLNDVPNRQSASIIGENSSRVFRGHRSDGQVAQLFDSPSQPAAEVSYFGDYRPDDQNYAQAFFQPFQPVAEPPHFGGHEPDGQDYAQAFFQPLQSTPGSFQFDGHGPHDQNYAQAFFQPFQPVAEPPHFDGHEPDGQDYAQSFNQSCYITPVNLASEDLGHKTSDLDFTADTMDRRFGHPCSSGAADLPPMTQSTGHQDDARVVNQSFQQTATHRPEYQNTARLPVVSPIQSGVTPYTAVLAA